MAWMRPRIKGTRQPGAQVRALSMVAAAWSNFFMFARSNALATMVRRCCGSSSRALSRSSRARASWLSSARRQAAGGRRPHSSATTSPPRSGRPAWRWCSAISARITSASERTAGESPLLAMACSIALAARLASPSGRRMLSLAISVQASGCFGSRSTTRSRSSRASLRIWRQPGSTLRAPKIAPLRAEARSRSAAVNSFLSNRPFAWSRPRSWALSHSRITSFRSASVEAVIFIWVALSRSACPLSSALACRRANRRANTRSKTPPSANQSLASSSNAPGKTTGKPPAL